jgi:oxalate decarboxylase/phosphoglucose isomerase-like protein (cupin superfamily)
MPDPATPGVSRRRALPRWHPNAAEWQYVVEGETSVTLFGSHSRYRIRGLQKGDVGYIPQGYGPLDRECQQRTCAHPDRI